jgi:hypothetical protein
VQRLRISGVILLPPTIPSRFVPEHLYFRFIIKFLITINANERKTVKMANICKVYGVFKIKATGPLVCIEVASESAVA